MTADASRRRWPLLLIGAAAGTATWSGWVGLGQLTGFGVVHPLPGIWDSATLNTAITLPIGVEAYAVYALSVATDTRPLTTVGRRYAWVSSAGALILGMAGQIAYHLMDAKAVGTAPWWIVAMVSCLPVLVLGAASLLWHLTAKDVEAGPSEPVPHEAVPRTFVPELPGPGSTVPGAVPGYAVPIPLPGPAVVPVLGPTTSPVEVVPVPDPSTPGEVPAYSPPTPVSPDDAEIVAQIMATGTVPSIREIKATHRIGGTRAVRIRAAAIEAMPTEPDHPAIDLTEPPPSAEPAEPTEPPNNVTALPDAQHRTPIEHHQHYRTPVSPIHNAH
jgi:hypothetical protein